MEKDAARLQFILTMIQLNLLDTAPEPKSKKCTKCGDIKLVEKFSSDKSKKDRLHGHCKKCKAQDQQKRTNCNQEKNLLTVAKARAKKKGLDCNLEEQDIIIPAKCPVLGIQLKRNTGGKCNSPNSPTLDRIDNDKGYIKGNVQIISWRANKIKADACLAELHKIVAYMEKHKSQQSPGQFFDSLI